MSGTALPMQVTESGLQTPFRVNRLRRLIDDSTQILDRAIQEHITDGGRQLAGSVTMFSGGDDSTILAHLFRTRVDAAAHANTGIGIEDTRQFVRDTCAAWGLRLIEKHPPVSYDELVIDQGFPGPGMHWKMYQRLKERCFRQVRAEFVTSPTRERVVFLAGRRRDESDRRLNIPEAERDGSVVWVSPLVNWTKLDLNTYRALHPEVPRNPASATLHMSGECLCGAFAHEGELDEIGEWYPAVRQRIEALQERVKAAGHAEPKCRWGWGAGYEAPTHLRRSGPGCNACDGQIAMFPEGDAA
jgi:3'-phosphoadenosine 5'-phosphosulfate sulfotransferase (PAPS reductase)/FAD synthetase